MSGRRSGLRTVTAVAVALMGGVAGRAAVARDGAQVVVAGDEVRAAGDGVQVGAGDGAQAVAGDGGQVGAGGAARAAELDGNVFNRRAARLLVDSGQRISDGRVLKAWADRNFRRAELDDGGWRRGQGDGSIAADLAGEESADGAGDGAQGRSAAVEPVNTGRN